MMTRADKMVTAISIIGIIYLYVVFWVGGSGPLAATVSFASEEKRLSLTENRRYSIPGRLGETVIEVSDERIRFVSSPCTSKRCVLSGWLDKRGDFAACLPNGVSLSLHGLGDRGFDAINF